MPLSANNLQACIVSSVNSSAWSKCAIIYNVGKIFKIRNKFSVNLDGRTANALEKIRKTFTCDIFDNAVIKYSRRSSDRTNGSPPERQHSVTVVSFLMYSTILSISALVNVALPILT